MTSKIIVNNIESDVGISSVTFNDTISGNLEGNINSSGTSTFNVISGVSTIGVTTVHLTGINDLSYPTAGPLSNRNVIVNGSMRISQRQTSLTGETGGGYKCLDRFRIGIVNLGTWTYTQSTDAPAGFSRSFKCECTTADASPAAGDLFNIQHRMEGQELQRLKKGTSSAESFTVSFWVKSNKTGTYNLQAEDTDNTRTNVRQYSIESANTWEYKTLTFDGDTTGALDDDTEQSFRLIWWLGSGTNYSSGTTPSTWEAATATNNAVGNVNLADSTSNVFYITGVQMETGSVATPFEHRIFSDELARCQRYFQKSYSYEDAPGTVTHGNRGNDFTFLEGGSTSAHINIKFNPEMRITPNLTAYSIANANTTGVLTASSTDYSVSTNTTINSAKNYLVYAGGVTAADDIYVAWTANAEL